MIKMARALPGEVFVTLPALADGDDRGFPALVDPSEGWNGHIVPRFREDVVRALVSWTATVAGPEDETLAFDGTTVLVHYPDYPDEPSSCDLELVDGTPRWAVGGYEWTWEIAD